MGITQARIGELRHRLTFQTRTKTSDGMGGFTAPWTDSFTVWGRVRAVSARERLFSQKMDAEVTHEIIVRYRTGITSEMRFTYDGRTFQVKAPFTPDERKAYITFYATEGVVGS